MTQSNSLNFLAAASVSEISRSRVDLISETKEAGVFWKSRASGLVEPIVSALVWRRDNRNLLLDVEAIRKHFSLDKIVELIRVSEVPDRIKKSLSGYCENLPGWEERKGSQQDEQTMEQHGYLQMQLNHALNSIQ